MESMPDAAGRAAADDRPAAPTVQVEPLPVTVTLAVSKNKSISAPPTLLSVPPLLMMSVSVREDADSR